MNLTIIRGLPGSGKTTLALDEAERTGAIVIESDQLRVRDGEYVFHQDENESVNATASFLLRIVAKKGADVILTGVFSKAVTVRRIIRDAERAFKGNEGEVHVRIVRCCEDYGTRHAVPERIIQSMAAAFEDIECETFHLATAMKRKPPCNALFGGGDSPLKTAQAKRCVISYPLHDTRNVPCIK